MPTCDKRAHTMSAFTPPLPPGKPHTRVDSLRPSVLRRARRSYSPSVHAPTMYPPTRRRATWRSLHNTPTPTPPPTHSGRTPDYHANVGSVIDQLRDFYPRLLTAEPDLAYYSRGVIFADSTGYRVVGHDAYRTAFWMLRAQARVFFASSAVSITSLYYDDASGTIYLRWRLQATPRGWALLAGPAIRGRSCLVMDGLSVYTLDHRGMVAVHQLENNARRRSGLRHMFEDILSVGTVRVPGTPAGAGVGSGTGSGAGVPPWFRSVYDSAEFVCLTGETAGLEMDHTEASDDMCEREVELRVQGEEDEADENSKSAFMERLMLT